MRAATAVAIALTVGWVALPLLAEVPVRDSAEAQARHYQRLTLEELMSLEIRAPAKVEQPVREAPTLCTVITREQIDAYGWLTLNDVLLRQPGFAPAQDYERVTVSSRGQYESWNNNHLRILVDGVPFNNVSNGIAYTWEMMPLSMVESIEIIRGPGSTLYGSSATNGVVAINTRKPSGARPAEAALRRGNAEVNGVDVAGGAIHPWFSFFTGYSHFDTRGNIYASYDGSGRTAADGRLRKFEVNDRRWTDAGFLKIDGRGPLAGLSLQVHASFWRFQTAQGWLYIVPDERERAQNNRELTWLTYRPPALWEGHVQLEFVGQWQRHEIDYRIKYLPDGYVLPVGDTNIVFPNGAVEIANAVPNDYFSRAQADFRFHNEMHLLLGIENTLILFGQDVRHEANIDLNRGHLPVPFPDNEFRPLNPLFEGIVDNPVYDAGIFLQYCSGRVFRRLVAVTAGARYDLETFDYRNMNLPGSPTQSKSLDQVSPRVALLFFPLSNLTLKALAERAFRAPAPTELFVTNSLLGNSRTDQLLPEELTAYTLGADLVLFRHLNLRADGFYQKFDNQIAFSATNNFTANLYTRTATGLETELLFDFPLGKARSLGGFFNYTLAYMLEENVLEPTIRERDRLTWAPEQVANLGLALAWRGWDASSQCHFQGRVLRRPSDSYKADGTPTFFSAYRPASVAPWFTVDAVLSYRLMEGLRCRVQGTNILNQRGYLLKPNDYPFDYRIPGARVLATIELALQNRPAQP